MNDRIFNRLTEISVALKSKRQTGRTFHTTFILEKKRIISIGINNIKSHPKTAEFDYVGEKKGTFIASLHSEMDSWLKLGQEDCSKYTFINIRINNNGKLDYSAPCLGCKRLMEQIGFKKFYYSNKNRGFTEYSHSYGVKTFI